MQRIVSPLLLVGIAVAGLMRLAVEPALANNVVVTNTTLTAPTADNVQVQFDLTWDNSWRDATNYDACWVFVKYSTDGGTNWSHATLGGSGTNPLGFTNGIGTNLDIVVPADKTGAFIQRSVAGMGTVSNTGVQLVWDFATNGVSKSKSARVKVFAVEMVCVVEGAFWAGSGGTESGHFIEGYGSDPSNNTPYCVTNEAELAIANEPGCLWGTSSSGNSTIGGVGVLSDAFPKGYAAFYCMKYEITQKQYADYLNTLAAGQVGLRVTTGISGSWPNFTVALTNRAMNYISWGDVVAYADWAVLRPMSELEYEKACRGPLDPVTNECAWGNTNIAGNFAVSPTDVGSFADATSTREQAGASYWGIMELSGSASERAVTVGHATGRLFTGLHGDGMLDAQGKANVDGWPGEDAYGAGYRGGNRYNGTVQSTCVSVRANAAEANGGRSVIGGGRAVRTAP